MFDSNNIKSLFAKSLNISGRINRTDHFLRKFLLLLAQIPITIIAIIIIRFIARFLGEPAQIGMSLTVDFFFIILFFIYAYFFGLLWNVITVLRLHDLNLDGRWCIINFVIFIPMLAFLFRIAVPKPGEYPLSYTLSFSIFVLFNIILLFAKGSSGENYYGHVPSYEKEEELSPYAAKSKNQQALAGPAKQAQSISRTVPNPYAVNRSRSFSGNGTVSAAVDKKHAKHSDRYQPKSARKK